VWVVSQSQCKPSFSLLGLWTLSPILVCGTGLEQCATWRVEGRLNLQPKWTINSKRYDENSILIYSIGKPDWFEKKETNKQQTKVLEKARQASKYSLLWKAKYTSHIMIIIMVVLLLSREYYFYVLLPNVLLLAFLFSAQWTDVKESKTNLQ